MCVCVYICVLVWHAHPCCRLLGSRVLQGVAGLFLTTLPSESHSKVSSVGSVFGSLQWGVGERPQGSPRGSMGADL